MRRRMAKVALAKAALRTARYTSMRCTKSLWKAVCVRLEAEARAVQLRQVAANAEFTEEVARQTLLQAQDELDREMHLAGASALPDDCREPRMAAPGSSTEDEEDDSTSDDWMDNARS